MEFKIETEKQHEIEAIQRRFADKLPESVILKATAQAINGTMKRAVPIINKAIKEEYNITQKGLKQITKVKPFARPSSLYAGLNINSNPLPLAYFRPKKTRTGVSVSVHKGKTMQIRNAVLRTEMFKDKSYGTGVWARGEYNKSGFVPGRERKPFTELKTASPATMGLNEKVAPKVTDFMGKEVLRTTEGILRRRVEELANG